LSASSGPIQSQLLAADSNDGSAGDDMPNNAKPILMEIPKRNRTKTLDMQWRKKSAVFNALPLVI